MTHSSKSGFYFHDNWACDMKLDVVFNLIAFSVQIYINDGNYT